MHLKANFLLSVVPVTVPDQPPPQALRFSHRRGERETRVTGDAPQGTFSSRERRLGTRQVLDSSGRPLYYGRNTTPQREESQTSFGFQHC